jgi:hypothetical protein
MWPLAFKCLFQSCNNASINFNPSIFLKTFPCNCELHSIMHNLLTAQLNARGVVAYDVRPLWGL